MLLEQNQDDCQGMMFREQLERLVEDLNKTNPRSSLGLGHCKLLKLCMIWRQPFLFASSAGAAKSFFCHRTSILFWLTL